MPRPLFSGGLPVYHGRSSESRTFLFSSGSKRLGARPLRGDSLLNIPPAFSFVNTFFPLFFSFFSPLFCPLNLVLFLRFAATIYTYMYDSATSVLDDAPSFFGKFPKRGQPCWAARFPGQSTCLSSLFFFKNQILGSERVVQIRFFDLDPFHPLPD